jgi:hypothetical protein
MSKQVYGVTTGTSEDEIKARAKKLKLPVPLFPGDGTIAAVLAHVKALEMGYQKPIILASERAFKTNLILAAASSAAAQYRAVIMLEHDTSGHLEDDDEAAHEIAKLLAEVSKYGADPTVVKQVLGRPPYGYLRVKGVLQIDAGAAPLIEESFVQRDKGKSVEAILDVLLKKFKEATTTVSGERWHKARVARILRRADMYREGKFRDCDGKRYTNSDLIIAPLKAKP